MPRCCLYKCLCRRQSNKEGWWNTRGPVLEAIHEAELWPAGAQRNWEPNPGRAQVAKEPVSWSWSFHDGEIVTGPLRAASPGAHLHKACLYFSTESSDSTSPAVEATQERKQRDAFCGVSHRPTEAPMWKSWILVFQTRKQGVGLPLSSGFPRPCQASRARWPQHPSTQTIPPWSAIWGSGGGREGDGLEHMQRGCDKKGDSALVFERLRGSMQRIRNGWKGLGNGPVPCPARRDSWQAA